MRTTCAGLAASLFILLSGCMSTPEMQAPQPGARPAPPLISNDRQGYAFQFPRILAEQRLFGIAHGVTLLADACRDDTSAAATYAQWHAGQAPQIDAFKNELATFYYGPRAGEATSANIVSALNLPRSIDVAPARLQEACASLPQALQQPRYNLAALFELDAALAQTALAVRVETQNQICAERLPVNERAALAAHYAAWQSREGASIADARTRLAEEWKVSAIPGKIDAVLKAMRQNHSNPSPATCAGLAAWLDTPAASLAQAFAPAPAPTAAATTPPDETPKTRPDESTGTP